MYDLLMHESFSASPVANVVDSGVYRYRTFLSMA